MRPGLLGGEVPGEVKRLSLVELDRLTNVARKAHLHATGRPEWIRRVRSEITYLFAHPLGWKSSAKIPTLRCHIGVVRSSHLSSFTLDIPKKEFDSLNSISDPWELSEILLDQGNFIPPDGDDAPCHRRR